jgi:hypothetical protein
MVKGVGMPKVELDGDAAATGRFARKGPEGYGSVATRVLFGVVLPTFTRIGSRSFADPVYFTAPSMFTSSRQ